MRRREMPDSCGLGAALEVIGGKWKAILLWEVRDGPVRFGELKRRVPSISEKVLVQHLRELEAHGVLRREEFDEVPPRVQYSITPLGVSLNEAITPLAIWGQKHEERILGPQPAAGESVGGESMMQPGSRAAVAGR